MPVGGDNVLVMTNDEYLTSWYGVFAGYDPETENYIVEDCYESQFSNIKHRMFFNRRYVKSISVLDE